MKTIINWHKVNLKKRTDNNLPRAGDKIFFISGNTTDISQICYSVVFEIEYKSNELFVTNNLGRTIVIKSGFVWCYREDIKTFETERDHPEIQTISQAREYAGITRTEMSNRLGIPLRSIEDWESGRRTPSAWAERLIISELLKIKETE